MAAKTQDACGHDWRPPRPAIGGHARPAALHGAPWSVRAAHGSEGRPAPEVHEAGDLADVIVATPWVSQMLCGGRRGADPPDRGH
jgi:hypothetical protein